MNAEYFMTRMECKNVLDKHIDLYYNGSIMGRGISPVLFFFRSPVTNEVESRQGFFIEMPEAIIWADEQARFYTEKKIPFALYICGKLDDSYGMLFDE